MIRIEKVTIEDIGICRLITQVTIRGIEIKALYIPKLDPETQAALGATLSRDPGSIESRLKRILGCPETKERIMEVYFKRYGHNSIGDMGSLYFP